MFDWKPGEMGWVAADGKQLEATCYGPAPGDAPTIVMLHEGPRLCCAVARFS